MRRIAALAPLVIIAALVATMLVDRLMDDSYPMPQQLGRGADLREYFYPAVVYLRSSLAHARIPLWNPYQMAGMPFLAALQPAVFYPPLLVCLWLPPHLAITAHGLLHLFLAGTLTFGYARRLGLHNSAALTAGLAYMLCYAVVIALYNTAYLSSYVWLPAVLWGVHEICETRSSRGVLILAGSLALGALSGHAQAFVYITQLAVVYALVLVAASTRRGAAAAALAGAALLAAGVACVQLVMTAELARIATRSLTGIGLPEAGAGFPTQELLEGLWMSGKWTVIPWATVALAPIAVLGRRSRVHAIFFAAAMLVLFDFMRGNGGYTFPLYYRLPLGNVFRFPARAAFAYAFCAAMLVGLGASALLERVARYRRVAAVLSVALPALVAADLYVRDDPGFQYLPLTRPGFLDISAGVAEFAAARAEYDRIFIDKDIPSRIPYKLGQMHETFVVPDYEPFMPADYRGFFGISAARPWPGGLYVTPDPDARDTPRVDPSVLDLLSVRYYVDARFGRRLESGDLRNIVGGTYISTTTVPIIERQAALPRVYVVHELLTATSHEEALGLVRRDGFDARHTAVVEGVVQIPDALPANAWEYARILTYEPQRVELEVRCASRCLAVLTDLYYPGWRVRVDDVGVDVVRVNYLVRGVMVPAGLHRVVYEYRPPRLAVAGTVSAGSLMTLLVVGLLAFTRRRALKRSSG